MSLEFYGPGLCKILYDLKNFHFLTSYSGYNNFQPLFCMTKTQTFKILKTYIEITPLEALNVGVAIFQNSFLHFAFLNSP